MFRRVLPEKYRYDVKNAAAFVRDIRDQAFDMEKERVFNRSAPIVAVLLLLSAGLSACSEEKSAAQAAPPPPPQVTVSKPIKKVVTDYDEYVGRFVAVDYVEVRARVSGYLDKIHFTDGQLVKVGDPLFTIDRRPFQAALDQAKASIEQGKANLAFAQSDLARGKNLALKQKGLRISEAFSLKLLSLNTRSDRAHISSPLPCRNRHSPPAHHPG